MKSLIKFSLKFLITVIVIAAFVYFGIKYVIPKLEQKDKKENLSADNRLHPVKKIIDGDTFETEIDGRSVKVRMLGIDTPEKFQSEKLERDSERTKRDKNTIMKLGELSYRYVSKLMGGKKVRLEQDPMGDDKDRYGRLLRYVYLEDGTFVNLKLVEDGYASAYRRFELTRKSELIEAERRARENNLGLWGDVEGLQYMGGN